MDQNKRIINLKVDTFKTFIKQYLSFINPFNPLTPGETDFLIELLSLESSKIEEEPIYEVMLLDYNNKQIIMERLNITEARLNNIISKLRIKGVIIKTKRGNILYTAYDVRKINLPYTFQINWSYNENKE